MKPQEKTAIKILKLEGLSKRFGGVSALEGVSFFVEEGKIIGLIGPNGAGKTTLFNCITGISAPDQGTVHFGETPLLLNRRTPYNIAVCGISRTFQTIRLFKYMTAI